MVAVTVWIPLIIALIGAIPATIAATAALMVGLNNRTKIGSVETKVDGHLSVMTSELAESKALILELTRVKVQFQGTQEERDRPS